jgi:dephospho-CoA kinase
MLRLGLTGSIGTGKSTTSAFFRAFGVPVHDADATVHRLYAGEAAPLIEARFPGSTENGSVVRPKLAALLGGKPENFAALEAIIHPLVHRCEAESILRAQKLGHRVIVLDIPLLFETGSHQRCDVVLVTRVDADVQKRRVFQRPGMNEALFQTLLARQMPEIEKKRRAHVVLDTGNGMEAARADVAALLKALAPMMGKTSG